MTAPFFLAKLLERKEEEKSYLRYLVGSQGKHSGFEFLSGELGMKFFQVSFIREFSPQALICSVWFMGTKIVLGLCPALFRAVFGGGGRGVRPSPPLRFLSVPCKKKKKTPDVTMEPLISTEL